MNDSSLSFPADFFWGGATAALQIEGSTRADGREPSIWDDFCRDHPERIHGRATPEPGCDHYRRWQEDLEWISKLGHNAYRFSISWPRGLRGLDFYDRLVDGLCARGVAPMATLYHWDLPSRLGSWENPRVPEEFADFVSQCADRLGDRVSHWMTLNEPAWSIMNGFVTGLHPPCLQDLGRAFAAGHQLMRAHHLALARLRAAGVRSAGDRAELKPGALRRKQR
jgi:beta-glucosidase/6-phospho-beta-glucosidase/beta-galactosidase